MNDLLHNTLDVAIALRKVEGAELRRRLVVVGVGFELDKQPSVLNGRCACKRCGTYDSVRPPLRANYPTHGRFYESTSVRDVLRRSVGETRGRDDGVYPDVAECIQPILSVFVRDFELEQSDDIWREDWRRWQYSGGAYSQSCLSAVLSMALAGSPCKSQCGGRKMPSGN